MTEPDGVAKPKHSWVPRHSIFFAGLIMLLVVVFEFLRLGLILRNLQSAQGATTGQVLSSFLYGLRFDLSIACYVALPVVVVGHLPGLGLRHSPKLRRFVFWALTIAVAVITFTLLAEFEFFREFQTRYNQLAFQYLDQPKIVGGMIWYNYPVIRYVLMCATVTVAFALALRWLMRRTVRLSDEEAKHVDIVREAIWMTLFIGLMVVAMRGGLQSEPLRWGNAYNSSNDFVNQMTLNGLFALGQSGLDRVRHAKTSAWQKRMPLSEARDVARNLVVGAHETLLDPNERTVLRRGVSKSPLASLKPDKRPPNVVLVVMESFSARYSAACGSPQNRTPRFDEIAKQGILFDHAFSGGTHTHQGVFCTMLGFPNLPGYEYLMENIVSNQQFLSLPAILKHNGYATMFIYNGNLAWDNMEGFFRKQGVDRFIGTDDFVNPIMRDRVWGVTDQDVFDRANKEFEAADKKGPFFSLVLTLSNHAPFDLPEPLPFERTTDMGEMNKRTDGVRYADWAVGHFIEEAKKLSYFDNTLFVFVGDHGFHVPPSLTEAHILFHHVPLLFYSKRLEGAPKVIGSVASQLNVIPSIIGLLGLDTPHASWGRNLFATDYRDENFAIFKGSGGSGSDQAVAMLRGDNLFVLDSVGTSRAWKLQLNPNPGVTPITGPDGDALINTMRRELFGYVQAAMTDVSTQKAGGLPAPQRAELEANR